MPTPSARSRRRPFRLVLLALAVLLLAGAAEVAGWWPAGAAAHAAWREDLADLEQHTARSYANFEWFVRSGRVAPRALHDSTLAALDRARTIGEARRAFRRFAGAFRDGHFAVVRPTPAPVAAAARIIQRRATPPEADWAGERACTALGYAPDATAYGLPFHLLDGYAPLPGDGTFLAGTFPLADGGQAGVLRFRLFSTRAHRSGCVEAWRRLQGTLRGTCDDACAERVDSVTGAVLLERLAARARALAAAGARTLVVDLTGNGGGEDIVDPMARTLAAVPLRAGPTPMLRHPHALGRLAAYRTALTDDLARTDLGDAQRATVGGALGRLDSLLAEVRQPCDWTAVWRTGTPPACSMLASGRFYSTGLLDYAAPGTLAGLGSAWALFGPSRFAYTEGAWRGPVVVVVDGRTASAAEGFAALLRDNGAATIVGERTYGAGCGYTDGGIRHRLPHTGLDVRLPDCVRSRPNGVNEVEGVTPDVVAWHEGDDGATRARRVRELVSGSAGRTASGSAPGS